MCASARLRIHEGTAVKSPRVFRRRKSSFKDSFQGYVRGSLKGYVKGSFKGSLQGYPRVSSRRYSLEGFRTQGLRVLGLQNFIHGARNLSTLRSGGTVMCLTWRESAWSFRIAAWLHLSRWGTVKAKCVQACVGHHAHRCVASQCACSLVHAD